MTANTTPRLGLMSPVDSDPFSSADFSTTFGKLDAQPGVRPVANYAAMNALGWGIPQHGTCVLQMDNQAMWMWNNPSGSGSWVRINSRGLLNRTIQNADVVATGTTGFGVKVVESGNLTMAGGRAIQVNCTLGLDCSSGANSMATVNLVANGSVAKEYVFRVGLHATPYGNNQTFDWFFTAPAVGSVWNYQIFVRPVAGSVSIGAGGTVAARTSVLNVIEV